MFFPHVKGRKKLLWMLVAILFAMSLLGAGVDVSVADPGTTVLVDPSDPIQRNPPETFTVKINVSSVVDLYMYGFKLSWNPEILEAMNVTYGGFLGPLTSPEQFTSEVFEVKGYVDVVCGLLGAVPGKSGNGTLATIDFQVLDGGNCALNLYDVTLINSSFQPIGDWNEKDSPDDGYFSTTIPRADFTYSPKGVYGHPIVDETVTFNASASYDPNGLIVSYYWEFGDDSSGTGMVTTHSYASPKKYTVTLKVIDNEGENDTYTEDITIILHDVAIANVAVAPTEVFAGGTVIINATVRNEGAPSGAPAEYFNITAYYDYEPIETKFGGAVSVGENVTVTFEWDTTNVSLGTYLVGAKVYLVNLVGDAIRVGEEKDTADNAGFDGNVTITGVPIHDIEVTDVTVSPEEVSFGGSTFVRVVVTNKGNIEETFNVTVYHDSTFISALDENVTLLAGEKRTLIFTWNTTGLAEGDYIVKANATILPSETETANNNRSVTATLKILPVADFTFSPSQPSVGDTVTFNASASEAFDGGTIDSYQWDFGDGTTEIYVGANLTAIATHDYTVADTYTVTLVVTDDEDLTDSALTSVTVLLHDIAVTNVMFFPNKVTTGETVSVNVTVNNLGDSSETFDVTIYYGDNEIHTWADTTLDVGRNITIAHVWNTTGVAGGDYMIKAVGSTLVGETDTLDNTRIGATLTIEKLTSTIILSVSSNTLTIGENITINGSISPVRAGANVTIWVKPSGGSWDTLVALPTDADGRYSHEWEPPAIGAYAIKSSLAGDANHKTDESDVQLVVIQEAVGEDGEEAPVISLYVAVGAVLITALIAALIAVYFVKIRKPAQQLGDPSKSKNSRRHKS